MRILAITHLYPTPGQSAFAPFNRQQFARLAQLNELRIIRPFSWPVAIGNPFRGRRPPRVHTSEDGIEVHTPTYYYPPLVFRHAYGGFFERSITRVADALIQAHRPEVVLGSWAHPDGWAAVRVGKRAGVPVVVKVHGSDIRILAQGRRRARIVETLQAADRVIAVSHELAAQVHQMGVPRARIGVVQHGVEFSRFTPGDQQQARRRLGLPAGKRLILFVGYVRRAKGAADLVEACAVLRRRGVDFECRLVGGGRELGTIRRLIHARGVEDCVLLAGVQPHDELPTWFRAADVVALPSHSEGIPNVLREALACGRPFVSTRVGGIPEIADPEFGRLVDVGDVRQLADALARMLERPPVVDPERVRQINITWEQSALMLTHELQSVVRSR